MTFISRRSLMSLAALALAVFCAALASAQSPAPSGQETFASPDAAAKALHDAVSVNDKTALHAIFGPQIDDLLTGDPVQDKANSQMFAKAIEENAKPIPGGDNEMFLEIGNNKWPFPIPLVKEGDVWRFDTAAGKEEIINRHIGKDELYAIGVCQLYVAAQKQYAGTQAGTSGAGTFARKFRSAAGKMDGLYWEKGLTPAPSPLGAKVALAGIDGVGRRDVKPFHGYVFKVLTRQGPSAPGGASDYIVDGSFKGGFALVAYPAYLGRSGVMTFIVNQDGKVYQRYLGATTARFAVAMQAYDPTSDWTLVTEAGDVEK